MNSSNAEMPACTLERPKADSLFERVAWFYALCREYLFRDHTQEIATSLFLRPGPADGLRLVEVGCGPGFYACRLAQEYPNIRTTGVDLSETLIQRAKDRAAARQLSNCSFQHADAHALPYPSASIDAVIVSRLFLIVPDKEGVVREIFRVLKPGGRCFIAEPTSAKYREPQQAEVMSRPDFDALVQTQAWESVDLTDDGWYQYAVCQRGSAMYATL